jgi:hypothetical protein
VLVVAHDILDIGRVRSGQFALVPRVCKLADLLGDMHGWLSVSAQAQRVALIVELQPSPPSELLVDAQRLRQVLLNLLGNGIRHTGKGFMALRVRRAEMAADDVAAPQLPNAPQRWRWRFEVEDTGEGIAAADLAELFTPHHAPCAAPPCAQPTHGGCRSRPGHHPPTAASHGQRVAGVQPAWRGQPVLFRDRHALTPGEGDDDGAGSGAVCNHDQGLWRPGLGCAGLRCAMQCGPGRVSQVVRASMCCRTSPHARVGANAGAARGSRGVFALGAGRAVRAGPAGLPVGVHGLLSGSLGQARVCAPWAATQNTGCIHSKSL